MTSPQFATPHTLEALWGGENVVLSALSMVPSHGIATSHKLEALWGAEMQYCLVFCRCCPVALQPLRHVKATRVLLDVFMFSVSVVPLVAGPSAYPGGECYAQLCAAMRRTYTNLQV